MLRTTLAWLDCVEVVRIRDQLCEENGYLPVALISWILVYFRLPTGCVRTFEFACIFLKSRCFNLKILATSGRT